MRFLPRPNVNDLSNLDELAKSKAAAAVAIKGKLSDIQSRYKDYHKLRGNPWSLAIDTSYDDHKDNLHALYKTPPKALSFIGIQRHGTVGACPMCGRDALGTLDHYLPKSMYYEFSFYSRNLVPACSQCNGPRKTALKGASHYERPIHCYYDVVADRRIMTVTFGGELRAPKIEPVSYNLVGAEKQMVDWHIEHIVKPSGFIKYAINLWAGVIRNPKVFAGTDKKITKIASKLKEFEIIEELQGNTPNAWKACFYHGLRSDPKCLNYIATLI